MFVRSGGVYNYDKIKSEGIRKELTIYNLNDKINYGNYWDNHFKNGRRKFSKMINNYKPRGNGTSLEVSANSSRVGLRNKLTMT